MTAAVAGSAAGTSRSSLLRGLAVLASGALFGFGLALSTMIRPEVVLGFLQWRDFGLMLVMGGAVVVTAAAYAIAPRLMRRPPLGDHFHHHVSLLNRPTRVSDSSMPALSRARHPMTAKLSPSKASTFSTRWSRSIHFCARMRTGSPACSRRIPNCRSSR